MAWMLLAGVQLSGVVALLILLRAGRPARAPEIHHTQRALTLLAGDRSR